MNSILSRINRLLELIDDAEKEIARYEGEQRAVVTSLKSEFGTDSIPKGRTLLTEWTNNLEEKEALIRARFEKMRENHKW